MKNGDLWGWRVGEWLSTILPTGYWLLPARLLCQPPWRASLDVYLRFKSDYDESIGISLIQPDRDVRPEGMLSLSPFPACRQAGTGSG